MTSNWWFRALQAGAEVALWQHGKGRRETVTRTTKTQILIGDLRFSRRDGYGIGSTCGFLRAADSLERDAVEHTRAHLEARVTSTSTAAKIAREKLAAFNEKHPVALSPESTSRKELLVGTFYLQDWSALPLETLEAIVALLTPEPASED